MANEVVGIDIVAKVDGLKAELSKLAPGMEKEAKAMVAALEKELKRAEKAAKSAASESRKAGDAIKTVGDTAGKAGQSAAKLAGALDLVIPGAGGAARAVADLADVGEVAAMGAESLGVSLGATALAAAGVAAVVGGALFLAYKVSNEEAERADQIGREVAASYAALDPIIRSTAAAQIDLQVATGQLTEAEAELLRIRDQAHASFLQATADTRKRVAELHAEQASLGTQIVDLGGRFVKAIDYIGLASEVYDGLTTDSGELQESIDAQMGTLARASEVTKANVRVTTEAAKAKRSEAAAVNVAAAAYEALEASAAADAARVGRVTSAVSQLVAIAEESTNATLDGEAKVQAAYDARLRAIGQIQAAAILSSRTETESAAAVAAGQQAAAAAEVAYVNDIDKARADAAKEEIERQAQVAEAAKRAREVEVAAYSQSASSIASASSDLASLLGEDHREAAMALYAVSKAAAITEATINTALAVSSALAEVPYPANIAVAAAMGVAGAAQVGVIAATPPPSFHTGTGMVGQDPRVGEINARLKAKEAVVSEQGVDQLGGRRVIEAANSGRLGRGSGGGGTAIYFGHRAIHSTMREAVRTDGPLTRYTNKGRIVGHRGRA